MTLLRKRDLMIPKIFMQTWKTDVVPLRWISSQESVRKHMSSWKYVLMTDEDNHNFVQEHFPDFLPYYDAFPYPIQRADAIRYCFLYIHGGIYMDLDMEIQRPLDDLFTVSGKGHQFFLVSSGNIGSYMTNAFMASTPRHPIWLEVIEAMKHPLPWWCLGKHFHVHCSTGPMLLSRVVKKSHHNYTMLPTKLLTPCSVCDPVCNEPNAYIKPLTGSSWIGWDTSVYIFLLCNWKDLLIVVIVVLLVLLGYWVYRKFKGNTRGN